MTEPPEGSPPSVEERVLDVVDSIPAGHVLTYGDIAGYLGLGSPRQVGRVLAGAGGPVPWHRVVRADGALVSHLAVEQSRRLCAEGVEVTDGRLDVDRYRWQAG